MFNIISHLLRQ